MHDHPRRSSRLAGVTLIASALTLPGPIVRAGLPTYAPLPDINARVTALLRQVPCSAVTPRLEGSKLSLSGWALPGEPWNRFRHEAGSIDGVTSVDTNVGMLAPFACGAVDTVSRFVAAKDRTNGGLTVRPDSHQVSAGRRLGIAVDGNALKAVRLDMYQPDGVVIHLRVGRQNGTVRADESLAAPYGPRLLVALSTPDPLDLGTRPSKEPSEAYLRTLNDALRGMTADEHSAVSAGVAVIDVRPPSTTPGGQAGPAKSAGKSLSPRCVAILQRLQLGETISDADRAALNADCRP